MTWILSPLENDTHKKGTNMEGRIIAGVAAGGGSVIASVTSWLTVAEQVLQIASTIVALVAGIVSLTLLLKKKRGS